MTLTLRDANYKEVAKRKVVTDSFGMASADFVLPASCLPGNFSVRCDFGSNGITSFSVEEYKRPTFDVQFDKLTSGYSSGDTVTVKGYAKTYAGVPVQGARVFTPSRAVRQCFGVITEGATLRCRYSQTPSRRAVTESSA